MQFTTINSPEIVIKARGKFIAKAVDIAMVTKDKFVQNVDVADVKLGSSEFKGREDKLIRVSTIEITLKKRWNYER